MSCVCLCLDNRDISVSDEVRTGETISRMSEVIAAQTSPVSLVVTGDDLSKTISPFHYWIRTNE